MVKLFQSSWRKKRWIFKQNVHRYYTMKLAQTCTISEQVSPATVPIPDEMIRYGCRESAVYVMTGFKLPLPGRARLSNGCGATNHFEIKLAWLHLELQEMRCFTPIQTDVSVSEDNMKHKQTSRSWSPSVRFKVKSPLDELVGLWDDYVSESVSFFWREFAHMSKNQEISGSFRMAHWKC